MNYHPDIRTLKQFAVISLVGFSAFAIAAASIWQAPVLALLLGLTGLGVCVLGMARPQSIKPVFVGLSIATHPVGLVVTHLFLAATYFLVLMPIGLVFRLCGRDVLQRRFDACAGSYWQPRRVPCRPDHYFRQF